MQTVYRIQHLNGLGLYSTCRRTRTYEQLHDMDKHPCPYNDGLEKFPDHWKFGFSSREQMKGWIYKKEWRKSLDAMGFRLHIFKVENCKLGGKQLVYDPESIIGEVKIERLCDET